MYVKSRLRTTWFIVIGLLLAFFAIGCDDYQVVTFDNQASFSIKVDMRSVSLDYSGTPSLTWEDPVVIIEAGQSQGLVGPRLAKTRKAATMRGKKFVVVAVNETNEIVFSKVFTWDELHDMNWTVVIKAQK